MLWDEHSFLHLGVPLGLNKFKSVTQNYESQK